MNTRKLIEGLYRQKFELENDIISVRESEAKKNEMEIIENISPAERKLYDQVRFVDELLIEFFGE